MRPHLRLFSLLLFLLPLLSTGQDKQETTDSKKIKIKKANQGFYQKNTGRNRLIGDVIFEHEGALMYCDSAWLYSKTNKIRAFENVRINQGDTLFLWGDYLEYDGNLKQARVTGEEVKLKDPKMELTTDQLDYNRKTQMAYYQTGGTIINDENELVSKKGYYNANLKLFNFKDSVVLTNPNYVIRSDTMSYNSNTRITDFLGPTTITSDSSFIYCENGKYNTVRDIAMFKQNARLYDQNKYLTGDSLYYEKRNEFGEAFGNVFIHDTIDNYVITGGYGQYIGISDSIFVTEEPVYTILENGDSLHIHGDTLFSSVVRISRPYEPEPQLTASITDSLADSLSIDSPPAADQIDTIATKSDSTIIEEFRLVRIFHKVKFYKSDLQGKCDSLTYLTADSIFRMYKNPILWNDSSQITGDTIYLTMRNKKMDSLKVYNNAFILSIIDDIKHNQVSGRDMFGKFANNELKKIYVDGNGQTIYYPKDDQKKKFIGMNRSTCGSIMIRMKNETIDKITFLTKPEAKLYPLKEATADVKTLDGFSLRFTERPESKQDLFK